MAALRQKTSGVFSAAAKREPLNYRPLRAEVKKLNLDPVLSASGQKPFDVANHRLYIAPPFLRQVQSGKLPSRRQIGVPE
jgi:hypothetical protein